MNSLLQDIRYALRTLAHSRTYTAVAVLCLALGIGLNTAVFSFTNAILLRPLPFLEADRVVSIQASDSRRGIDDYPLSAADFLDWTESSTTLSATAALVENVFVVSARGEESERVEGFEVTANTFRLLGLTPALGRDFTEDEGRKGGPHAVLLSHALWQNRYGGDRGIVGRTMDLDGSPHTIVGVMKPGMRFPETALLWVPFQPDRTEPRSSRYIWGVGRLAPGATPAQAQAELGAVAVRLGAEFPRTNAGWTARVLTFQDYMVDGPLALLLALMLAAVGCVLLVACANVANLLLARATARRREIALRAALGASRGRLVRQLLTESVIVALAGGLLGLLIAFWFIDAMMASIPEELPYWLHVDIDPIVLAYAVAVSVATGLIFGLLPAIRASRTDLQRTLNDGGRGTSGGGGNRLRGALVSGQVALSLVLLVSASLMMRSFLAIGSADAGFDPAPLLTARTYMAGDRYAGVDARAGFLATSVERLQGLPGVVAAAATSAIPTDDGGSTMPVLAEGQPRAAGDELIGTIIASTPGLFDALGTPLLAGRTFTAQETADSASMVAIINRELATQLWPGADPIGRRVRLPVMDSVAWLTVVGVAPDIMYEEFGEVTAASRRQVHLPYGRMPRRYMGLVVRSQGAASVPAAGLREAMRAIDPALPTFDVRTMTELRRWTTWNYALYGWIFSVFSAIALLLAAIGIYGVVAYAVSQRTHEIGVRMALGADSRGVQRLIVMQGARMVAVGLVIGLVAAVAAGRAVSGLLYGVPPTDPLSFVLVPLVLASVALFACWVPSRRATRVSPTTALRAG